MKSITKRPPHARSLSSNPTVIIYGGPGRHAEPTTHIASPHAAAEIPPIVVGVDGSEGSRDALALAARLVQPGQHLLLAHVRAYGGAEARGRIRRVPDATFRALRETLDPAVKREMRLVDKRSASAGLHDLARSTGAALIVVGSSHRTRLGRLIRGSVAESALRHARAPIAVAPRGYAEAGAELRTIGCGVDGSPPSLRALAWAVHLARRRGLTLRVLAVHTPIAFGGISTTGAFGYESATGTVRRDLDDQMGAAIAAHGLAAERQVLDGDPAAVLTEATAGLDLLVLGSRDRGRIRSLLFGSVARELVRCAVCPIVLVPSVPPAAACG
jgi:nucleotide-binding universal stress UspA family protein